MSLNTTKQIKNPEVFNRQNVLPRGWRWVKLGEMCEINPSKPNNFCRSPRTQTTFVPMAAVDGKTGNITNPEVVPYSKVAKGYTYFEEKDVLFAKITPCMQNGKHVIAKNLIDGVGFGITEFHVLRTQNEVIPEWIHFFIRQPYFLQEATAYFTGAVGQQRIPGNFLSNYIISLPPLPEQHRITAKLKELMQEIDRARTACEKELEAAKALPSAYLREVFESDDAKKWERKKLGEVARYINGRAFKPEEWKQKGIPIIRIQNLNDTNTLFNYYDGKIEKRYKVKNGDLLISWSASLGAYIWTRNDAILNQHIFKVEERPELINKNFLYYVVSYVMTEIKDRIHGATMQHITKPEFEAIFIPVPSSFKQTRIVDSLKEKIVEAKRLQSAIRNQQSALNILPQTILRKAFRGEL